MPQRNAPRRSSSFAISSLTTNGSGSCGSVPICTTTPPRFTAATQDLSAPKLPGHLVGDVELRRGERIGVAIGAQRDVGADGACLRERPVEHVGHRDARSAGESRRHHGQAADRSGAGDEHRLAEQVAARLTPCSATASGSAKAISPSDASPGHRIALALAHDEVLLEHALHVREQARAAQERICVQRCSRPSRQ